MVQDFLAKWPHVFLMPDKKIVHIVKLLVNDVIHFFEFLKLCSEIVEGCISLMDICRL